MPCLHPWAMTSLLRRVFAVPETLLSMQRPFLMGMGRCSARTQVKFTVLRCQGPCRQHSTRDGGGGFTGWLPELQREYSTLAPQKDERWLPTAVTGVKRDP